MCDCVTNNNNIKDYVPTNKIPSSGKSNPCKFAVPCDQEGKQRRTWGSRSRWTGGRWTGPRTGATPTPTSSLSTRRTVRGRRRGVTGGIDGQAGLRLGSVPIAKGSHKKNGAKLRTLAEILIYLDMGLN